MLYEELIERNLDWTVPVLTDMTQEKSYAQLHLAVSALSERMSAQGAQAGQRVVIVNGNTIQTVLAILACIQSRLCFIIVPAQSGAGQIEYIVSDADPVLIVDTSGSGDAAIKRTESGGIYGEDIVYIIYTSGSSGTPKGVVAPEAQVEFCINAINARLKNGAEDRILCCLPLSFDYGLYQLFFALKFRCRLVLPSAVMIQQIPKLLVEEQITAFPAMPAMLAMLLRTGLLQKVVPLPALRYITSTGDNFPLDLIGLLRELFPQTEIIPMYGQTECKRVSIMPFGCASKSMAGSCGLPLDGTRVWLDEPDEHGVGELIVSGPNVMDGYLNADKEASAYFFTHPKYGRCLRTGDLFRIDSEGYLYFCGRKRRIIKVSGYRVGGAELENRLLTELSMEGLSLRVVGLPDELTGAQILLCISSTLNPDPILERLRKAVSSWPAYQRPAKVYWTPQPFPLSVNGKTDDAQLLEEAICHGVIAL